jgi:hypothetical protein
MNLPFYLSRRFFRVGNPILLFEHLSATYGRMARYRVGSSHIVLVNEPEFIREILVTQPQNFIKERTQKRMKILLGEGLITSDDPSIAASGASPRPPFTASVSRPMELSWSTAPWPCARAGSPAPRSTSAPR